MFSLIFFVHVMGRRNTCKYIYIYIFVYLSLYIYIYIYIYTSMYICMHKRGLPCMYIYMYMYSGGLGSTNTYIQNEFDQPKHIIRR